MIQGWKRRLKKKVNEKQGTSWSASRCSHRAEWQSAILNFTCNSITRLNEILATCDQKQILTWGCWNVMFGHSHLIFVEWQEIRRIWRRWPACGRHWASDVTCCLPRDTSAILHSLLVCILPWRKGKLETKISAIHMFNTATRCRSIGCFLQTLPVPYGTLSLHIKHHHAGPAIH